MTQMDDNILTWGLKMKKTLPASPMKNQKINNEIYNLCFQLQLPGKEHTQQTAEVKSKL